MAMQALRATARAGTTVDFVRQNPAATRTLRIHQSAGAAADRSRQRLFLEEPFVSPTTGQVFWLPDLTTFCTFPRQVSQSKASLGHPGELHAVAVADFVPGYSGGTATDSHRLPYSSPRHQAVRDTQVFVRVQLWTAPERRHRNTCAQDFNREPSRFFELAFRLAIPNCHHDD
jgi:hypothetical protein